MALTSCIYIQRKRERGTKVKFVAGVSLFLHSSSVRLASHPGSSGGRQKTQCHKALREHKPQYNGRHLVPTILQHSALTKIYIQSIFGENRRCRISKPGRSLEKGERKGEKGYTTLVAAPPHKFHSRNFWNFSQSPPVLLFDTPYIRFLLNNPKTYNKGKKIRTLANIDSKSFNNLFC